MIVRKIDIRITGFLILILFFMIPLATPMASGGDRGATEDGGWGEDCDTYFLLERAGKGYSSTSFQTAWAILGLVAAGEVDSPEVRKGVEFLMRTQQTDGLWEDEWFTAPGFPRVFYLKYHGYAKYFPLWALARYRNLRSKKSV